jgi:phage baseplate assembly protein gpV
MAKQVIEDWLTVKRLALGKDHKTDGLAGILLEPLLTQWQRRAQQGAQENWYWEYDHQVEVASVNPDDPTADKLQVTAMVKEKARLFEYDVENTSASYDDQLTMRYDLVRQEGKWYVQNMGKLASGN